MLPLSLWGAIPIILDIRISMISILVNSKINKSLLFWTKLTNNIKTRTIVLKNKSPKLVKEKVK
jgi:hypothetical protein